MMGMPQLPVSAAQSKSATGSTAGTCRGASGCRCLANASAPSTVTTWRSSTQQGLAEGNTLRRQHTATRFHVHL